MKLYPLWGQINAGADTSLIDEVMDKTTRKLAVPLFQEITSDNGSYRGADSVRLNLVRWVLD
jgi:hypothetical protein